MSNDPNDIVHPGNDDLNPNWKPNWIKLNKLSGPQATDYTEETAVITNGDLSGMLDDIAAAKLGITPIGGIILWSGFSSELPSNWKLCDGLNGTPNLVDTFIIGSTIADISTTQQGSGSPTSDYSVQLTTANIPPHGHSVESANGADVSIISSGKHSHGIPLQNTPGGGGNVSEAHGTGNLTGGTYESEHTHTKETFKGYVGIGFDWNNPTIINTDNTPIIIPPKKHYKLAYIMRIS